MVQHLFYEVALVCVNHLAVFGDDHMGCLVAVLPHVVPSQVKWCAAQSIFVEGNIAEYVLALHGPGEGFPFSHGFVLPVV